MGALISALALVVSTSCAQQASFEASPVPSASPKPPAEASASPSPNPAIASPTASPPPHQYLLRPITTVAAELAPPTGPIGFSCSLPIYLFDANSPLRSQVGFLSVPSGGVAFGPAPTLPPGSGAGPQSLYASAFYYDIAYSRWLPAARGAVSADGHYYAYPIAPAIDRHQMRVVDVATGSVRA